MGAGETMSACLMPLPPALPEPETPEDWRREANQCYIVMALHIAQRRGHLLGDLCAHPGQAELRYARAAARGYCAPPELAAALMGLIKEGRPPRHEATPWLPAILEWCGEPAAQAAP